MSAWRASRAKRLVLLYLYLYIGMAEIYTDPPRACSKDKRAITKRSLEFWNNQPTYDLERNIIYKRQ